jgi:hypothetical protein
LVFSKNWNDFKRSLVLDGFGSLEHYLSYDYKV